MKTPAERGPVGRWLVAERLARGWSQARARDELAAAGIPLARSTFAQYEAGQQRPSPTRIDAIAAFYGSRPEDEQAGLREVLELLRQSAEAQLVELRALVDTTGAILLFLSERGRPEGEAPVDEELAVAEVRRFVATMSRRRESRQEAPLERS